LDGIDEAKEIVQLDLDQELFWVPKRARHQVGKRLSYGDKRRQPIYRLAVQYWPHRFAVEFFQLYGKAYDLPAPAPEGHESDQSDEIAAIKRGFRPPADSSRRGIEGASSPGRGIEGASKMESEGASMPLSTVTAPLSREGVQGESIEPAGQTTIRPDEMLKGLDRPEVRSFEGHFGKTTVDAWQGWTEPQAKRLVAIGCSPERESEKFIARCRDTAKRSADWEQAGLKWVSDAEDYSRRNTTGNRASSGTARTVQVTTMISDDEWIRRECEQRGISIDEYNTEVMREREADEKLRAKVAADNAKAREEFDRKNLESKTGANPS
jgi:hypothetical protein